MDPQRKALARKVLIGVGGVTLVAAVGAALWNAIADRPPKFARIVAEDFPADAVGMLAVDNPAHALELLDQGLPDELRAELKDELGFDPLAASSWADRGFDLEAPVGIGVTDVDRPVFMISIGLDDASKARESIRESSEELGLGEWEDRQFAGADGLWRDYPPIAVVFRNDRMIVFSTEDADSEDVEDTADEVAKMRRRDSLAATDSFRNIHRFAGDPIMMGYANIGALTNNPMTAMTIGSTDIEAMAFALTSDDRDIHFISQTVFSDDSDYLRYVSNRDRSTRALDHVPGPVFAGFHTSIDPQYLRDMIDELGGMGKSGLEDAKDEAQSELGIDLEDDVLAAWTGEVGVLWTSTGSILDDNWGGMAFAGVKDEAATRTVLERVWSRTDGSKHESTDAGELYIWDERPEFVAKVYDGQIWFGLGHSRLEDVDDDAKGFRKTTESDAIADLLSNGSMTVAFVDLVELREVLGEIPNSERVFRRYADVIDELEALTMTTEADGNTFTWTMTLHTKVDDAFDTLLERLIADIAADANESMFDF